MKDFENMTNEEMEKEEILKSLKEQYTDEVTLKILINYINEFQQCFGKYIPTEEVIKRIKQRVKFNIEITDEYIDGNLDGQYDISDSTVRLHKSVLENEDYCAYLTFHELTHAITVNDLQDGRKIMGFSFIKNQLGLGLNEAMTEWLTQIRNKKFGKEGKSGYETIVEQIIHLAQIIGEDNLINCFLYEPEKLEELLKNNNMDYNELEEAFYKFVGKDAEVYNLGNNMKLNNIQNYNLYKQAEIIFDNYSDGIGNIDSIELFKRKYQILSSYRNQDVNINKIMEFHYYTSMFSDITKLIQKGIPEQEIYDVLRELNVPPNNYKLCNEFKKMLSGNKKQSAILLNDFFRKYPNEYYDFALQNYSFLYDKFSETPLYPQGENLYDVAKYAMIGRFLSGHPDYEYDEISTRKLIGSNNSAVYCFKTLYNSQYVYTIPNGLVEKIGKDKFKVTMQDTEVTLSLGDSISYETKGKNVIHFSLGYSESSQLEDIEYYIDMENVDESEKEKYKQKAKEIRKKNKEKNQTEL